MTKRAGTALLIAFAALFLISNRAAYKGYFQDDELNNLSWARDFPAPAYAKAVLTPKFSPTNFRPVGHYYFHEMSLRHGLDFPRYLPILHFAHILNVWLLWMLARRVGLPPLASSLGTLFFAFNMAVFDIYWKPMYVFDLFCATFSLASILLYTRRRYVLSFCAFWLAYKSKELAVMLPLVLACYEFWLAEKRSWKPLIPFFAVSLSFGLQGVLLQRNVNNEYTFRFTPAAVRTTLSFYSSRIFLIPYAGLALIPLPFLVRDRRLWFGAAVVCLFFVPLMFLPGRLFSAYCYLPLAGFALMAGTIADLPRLTPVVALLCVLWIPWNIVQLRKNHNNTLSAGNEVRAYVSALVDFSRRSPTTRVFVFDGLPAGFRSWGTEGALYFLFGYPNPALYSIDDKEAAAALKLDDVALLRWNPGQHKLDVLSSRVFEQFLTFDRTTPPWQLGAGWYSQEDGFRWTAPRVTARLAHPDAARDFELVVNVSPEQIRQTGPITVTLSLNGIEIGKRQLTANGIQSLRWRVDTRQAKPPAPPPGMNGLELGNHVVGQAVSPAGPSRRLVHAGVEFLVTPEYRPPKEDPRRLGLAVVAFGFR